MILLLAASALFLTVFPDLAGWARQGVPEGYEDGLGFHFGRPAATAEGR